MSILGYLTPDFIYSTIYEIDFDILKKNNIKGLIFDIDNTLVSYEQPEPTSTVIELMNNLKSKEFSICFISNNNKQRVDLFNSSFKYPAFYDARKPTVKFFKEAIIQMNMKCENIAVIGDQLFTDVIAAKRMKMTALLVNPIEPVESFFFKIKRIGEKPFIRRYYRKLKINSQAKEKIK